MDSEFVGRIGRKVTLAVVVASALMAFASASHAGHFYRTGYYPRAYAYPRHFAARYYGGGYGFHGYRYRGPVRYYRAPRPYVSFGFSFGAPRYYAPPPAYVYAPPPVCVAPHRVYREPAYDDHAYEREDDGDLDRDADSDRDRDYDDRRDSSRPAEDFDVENEPPAGTYYYDPSCKRNFSTLDDYTDHLDSKRGHAKTIEIIDRESGKRVRTLEFVEIWQVQE